MSRDGNGPIMEVQELKKYFVQGSFFSKSAEQVKAVDGVSFTVEKGETLGIVGESGSGKTTLTKVILRLLEPTGGNVSFEGESILKMKGERLRKYHRNMQVVFQDPYGSLNPRMKVGEIVGEPFKVHGLTQGMKKEERTKELLTIVGLDARHIYRYPHMFSGGQRQRISIARALALNPKFIILDEPVSALDVSIQSQILNLLQELQGRFSLTYMFIAHNLSVIKHVSSRVAVMYLGKIVELAPVKRLFDNPTHPYTEALLSSIPVLDPDLKGTKIVVKGDIPSPSNIPKGCRFHTRCPFKVKECTVDEPEFKPVAEEHFVSCHLRS